MTLRWQEVGRSMRKNWDHLWRDHRIAVLNKSLWVGHAAFSGQGLVILVTLVVAVQRWHRRCLRPVEAVAIWFLLANYLLILAFMPVSWERYYLPTLIAALLVASLGVTWLTQALAGQSDRPAKLDVI